MEKTTLDPSAIRSALTRTQINDGFFVKRTESIDDTISFLTLMTRYLQEKYLNQDLIIINERALFDYEGSLADFRRGMRDVLRSDVFIPYNIFQDMSSKSKLLTHGDLFIKQLLNIRGISVPRALAIAKKYPTFKR